MLDVDPRVGVNVVVGKIKGFTSHELRNEFPWLGITPANVLDAQQVHLIGRGGYVGGRKAVQ